MGRGLGGGARTDNFLYASSNLPLGGDVYPQPNNTLAPDISSNSLPLALYWITDTVHIANRYESAPVSFLYKGTLTPPILSAKTKVAQKNKRNKLKKTCPEFFVSQNKNMGFGEMGIKNLTTKIR
jgi:hypothetical protein